MPDKVLGLPVWDNDPRWSMLGYAFDPPGGEPRDDTSNWAARAAAGQELRFLVWAEDLLEVRASHR